MVGALWGSDRRVRTLYERRRINNNIKRRNVRLGEKLMRSKAYSTIFIPLLVTICVIGFVDTAAADNDLDDDN